MRGGRGHSLTALFGADGHPGSSCYAMPACLVPVFQIHHGHSNPWETGLLVLVRGGHGDGVPWNCGVQGTPGKKKSRLGVDEARQ